VSYLALFNRANVRGSRLGLVPVSGDDNQILYLEGYASFAELEATRNKSDETFAASPALQAELAADPDFWSPKPAVKLLAMKTENKKEAKEAKQ